MRADRLEAYQNHVNRNKQLALPVGWADLLGTNTQGADTFEADYLEVSVLKEKAIRIATLGETTLEAATLEAATLEETTLEAATLEATTLEATTLEATTLWVLSPILYSFVMWTLQKATKDKVERLYFLARDGYLMYKVAKIIVQKMNLPIQCHYLYCSRYSLRTPLFHLNVEDALDYICRNSIKLNLRIILKRSGISRAQREEVIKDLALGIKPEEDIPYARLKKIRKSLQESQVFINYLKDSSMKLIPSLGGYLAQEGLLDDVKCAIVDSGWTGFTQKVLNEALCYFGVKRNIVGYYWGLYTLPTKKDVENCHGYYFMPAKNIKEKVYFSNSLFEAVFSAPHGMTLGYRLYKGRYTPFYLPARKEVIDFQKNIEDVILQYTEIQLSKINNLVDFNSEKAKDVIFQVLKLFMTSPTREEVACFGEIAFCDDVFEDSRQPIAAKLSNKDLKDNKLLPRILAMLGFKKDKIRESGWYEGSVIRSEVHVNKYLRHYIIYKKLRYMRTAIRWKLRNE